MPAIAVWSAISTSAASPALPGMQSAFIEVGLGALPSCMSLTSGNTARRSARPEATPKPIEKLLHEGQPADRAGDQDPIGTKGARLSTQISLAGRLLVHLPQDSHIGISQRIEDGPNARC